MNAEYFESVVEQLWGTGIVFEDGLSDAEVEATQSKFGFVFPPDLRMFLQTALPVSKPAKPGQMHSKPFPNWRLDNEESLWQRLQWPYEGMCFDIGNGFWMEEWGTRPESNEEACAIAREKINQAPMLIPIYGHRYIPDAPSLEGNPVYSVWQTDIIYYGFDLPGYLANEFKIENPYSRPDKPRRIDFWSALPGMWSKKWD